MERPGDYTSLKWAVGRSMQFMIEGGRWVVNSDDLLVNIKIRPRRSLSGGATELTLRAAPMPLMTLHPEEFPGAESAAAWVWDGSPKSAREIVVRILEGLKVHLAPEAARSGPSRRWRTMVLASLFKPAPEAAAESQTKRA